MRMDDECFRVADGLGLGFPKIKGPRPAFKAGYRRAKFSSPPRAVLTRTRLLEGGRYSEQ